MLCLTEAEVIELRQLLISMYGDVVVSIAYRSKIAKCLTILSKQPI